MIEKLTWPRYLDDAWLIMEKAGLCPNLSANRVFGLGRHSLRESIDPCVRRTVCLAIVRPHLGYATQVWSPQSVDLIRLVEQVQRRTTNVILNLPFQSSVHYKQPLLTLNLIPTSYWHEYMDLTFFLKCINNLTQINPTRYIPTKTSRTRSTPCVLQFRHKFRTPTFWCFFARTCKTWNTVPQNVWAKGRRTLQIQNRPAIALLYNSSSRANPEVPRPWKSVCPKCNTTRGLSSDVLSNAVTHEFNSM